MTLQKWLIQATARLTAALGESARRDAEILLAHVTGKTRAWLLAFCEALLTEKQHTTLEKLIERRENGEPIAYLLGECGFWSLNLRILNHTFIPRPDTESLVQRALDLLPPSRAEVLDLGTGSGAIALALASERSAWQITGVDRFPSAVALARDNAAQLRLSNAHFSKSDWFVSLPGKRYNLIISNPPYIDENDPHLIEGDVRFEPLSALVAGNNGLEDLKKICQKASLHLLPNGWLLLEHGWSQGRAVRTLLSDTGFTKIFTLRDYGGNERVSQGQLLSLKAPVKRR